MTRASKSKIFAALTAMLLGPTPAGAQISDDVVRIGVSTDHNGVNSAATGLGTVAAVRLAVKDFGGTVAGKPIEVVVADDQGKPDVGASNVRAWAPTFKRRISTKSLGANALCGLERKLRDRARPARFHRRGDGI